MVVDAMIRAAAVGGVASMWCYFTLKTFKICEQIVFPPTQLRLSNCRFDFLTGVNSHGPEGFYESQQCERKENVCERCGERFFDDEELEIRYGDEENNKPLCKNCSGN